MSLKSFFKVVEKAKETVLETPTCSSRTAESHEKKGDTESDSLMSGDDEMVASPPKRIKTTRSEQIKLSKSRIPFNSQWLHDFPWVRHYPIVDEA